MFSDKVIDDANAEKIRRMISMTKVGMLFEEEAARRERTAAAESRAEGRAEGVLEKAKTVYENCIARGLSKEDAVAISEYDPDAENG